MCRTLDVGNNCTGVMEEIYSCHRHEDVSNKLQIYIIQTPRINATLTLHYNILVYCGYNIVDMLLTVHIWVSNGFSQGGLNLFNFKKKNCN
jgi:hypothetical protein